MTVRSPSFYALVPVNDTMEVEGSLVYDAMSGASPLYFNTLSGASGLGITDYRTAGEVKITKYFGRLGARCRRARSRRSAITCRAAVRSTSGSFPTIAIAPTRSASAAPTTGSIPSTALCRTRRATRSNTWSASRRRSRPTAIVQSNVTYSYGPRLLLGPVQAARQAPRRAQHLRVAHALQPVLRRAGRHAAAVVSLPARLVRRRVEHGHRGVGADAAGGLERDASFRYYTQSAASLLSRPAAGSGFASGSRTRPDTRLSAFGAFTLGVDVAKSLGDGWSVDLRVDCYQQESGWRPGRRQPGTATVLRALDRRRHLEDVLRRARHADAARPHVVPRDGVGQRAAARSATDAPARAAPRPPRSPTCSASRPSTRATATTA